MKIKDIIEEYKKAGLISEDAMKRIENTKEELMKIAQGPQAVKFPASRIILGRLLEALIWGAGFAGASALTIGGIQKVQDISKARHFENMLGKNPDLKRKNALEVRKYFNSLYNFAPTIAKDPVAAGAAVNQFLLTSLDPRTAELLLKAQLSASKVSLSPFQATLGEVGKGFAKGMATELGRSVVHPFPGSGG